VYPAIVPFPERGPEYSYTGLVVRAGPTLDDTLRERRFSGWVGPDEDGWVVLVALRAGRPDLGDLARRLAGPALVARVHRDRVLTLLVADGDREIGRYHSNPTYGRDADDAEWVDPDPVGVEHAPAIAATFGRDGEGLAELLADLLDTDEQTESERLWAVLRLLGLPSWLVACQTLPAPVPGGPLETTLMYRGRTGRPARIAARIVRRLTRSRRTPVPGT
jgi:hypothetical protein